MSKAVFRRAVGLSYSDQEMTAPEVSVKGDALDADQIVSIAKKYGIPVVDRAELAQALELIDAGSQIPETLYRAVAVVLAELEKKPNSR